MGTKPRWQYAYPCLYEYIRYVELRWMQLLGKTNSLLGNCNSKTRCQRNPIFDIKILKRNSRKIFYSQGVQGWSNVHHLYPSFYYVPAKDYAWLNCPWFYQSLSRFIVPVTFKVASQLSKLYIVSKQFQTAFDAVND